MTFDAARKDLKIVKTEYKAIGMKEVYPVSKGVSIFPATSCRLHNLMVSCQQIHKQVDV